ncbi:MULTISPECIES: hypothetical protein [Pseudoalteromonas]|nr:MULTISPECIES: hypothetical protein [Pseudoalteromonas]MBE0371596.1 hypothetical protein [Pseudoalteromonas flavipulchra NCIMB 2033 = ATCC BAA-314]MDP4488993.1 hypothetical protein [Pseudoalteromonas piscicida]
MLYKVKAVLGDAEHRQTAINACIALAIRVLGAEPDVTPPKNETVHK